jgi:hypothetical protein
VKAKGSVKLETFRDDELLYTFEDNNLIVNLGLALIASRMEGVNKAVISHMSVGDDGTAPAGGDTDLISMLDTRLALDSTNIVTTTETNDTIQYICTYAAGVSTGDLREAAIFNAASGGDMLSRISFPLKTKGSLDVTVITWKVQFT